MSLDVYLTGATREEPCMCPRCLNDHTKKETEEFFSANITHNMSLMAQEAGIYNYLWEPDEIGLTKAAQLVEPLRAGVALMKSDRARFEKHNPPNGWGSYEAFVPWIEKYLMACEEYPTADVRVSR